MLRAMTEASDDEVPPDRLVPMQTNEVAIVAVGMAGWALALILLATVFRHDLDRHHASWWLWACGLGLVLGLYGLRFTLRRRRRD
jgi:membrane protein DedA with SNARE-associated domain